MLVEVVVINVSVVPRVGIFERKYRLTLKINNILFFCKIKNTSPERLVVSTFLLVRTELSEQISFRN